jgi:hypothetical protein
MTSKPKKMIRTLMVGAAAVASLTLTTSAHAAAGSDHLNVGEALYPGQSIWNQTSSGPTTLTMQDNGDLVLQASDGRVCWDTGTTTGFYAIYQSDDNFVVYDQNNNPVWASNTVGDGGDDTNVNMYGQLWVGEDSISGYCVQ